VFGRGGEGEGGVRRSHRPGGEDRVKSQKRGSKLRDVTRSVADMERSTSS